MENPYFWGQKENPVRILLLYNAAFSDGSCWYNGKALNLHAHKHVKVLIHP